MPLKLFKLANVSGTSLLYRNPSMSHPVAGFMRIGPWFLTWIRRRGKLTPKGSRTRAVYTPWPQAPSAPQTSPQSFGLPEHTIENLRQRLSRLDHLLGHTHLDNLKDS